MTATVLIAIYILGTLLLGVSVKCGLEDWLIDHVRNDWFDWIIDIIDCPVTIAFWPAFLSFLLFMIPFAIIAAIFDKSTSFIANRVCPKSKSPRRGLEDVEWPR